MNRLTTRFDRLKQAGKKALIPFVTAGDPMPDATLPLLHAMVDAGADIIELGVPFSDPMADGPVIQRASERALAHKMSLRKVLDLVERFRKADDTTPVVLMGYLNPLEAMGYGAFVARAKAAGVDGVLTVDLPAEESSELLKLLEDADIAPIFLLAPNSTEERIARMGRLGRGYLYYVSLKGVTGASHLDLADVERKLTEIRRLTDLPVGVGFGVKNAETAAAVAKLADGVVVGSALVAQVEQYGIDIVASRNAIAETLRSMRLAMDT